MLPSNKTPCKNCLPPKRNEKCHSICTEYLEWKEAHEHKKALAEDEKRRLYQPMTIGREAVIKEYQRRKR